MNLLFVGLSNLSDDEIRGQIALLRCVTFSNTIKERGQKAVKYFVEAASGMFGMGANAGKDEMIELLNTRKLIDNTYNDLMRYDRDKLNDTLKRELISKVAMVSGKTIRHDISEDGLFVMLVREAAKVYGIDENKTPYEMADEIHDQYYEHYLKVLQRKIMNMSQAEKATLETLFQRAIPKADIQQMRQLANELMLREFNGKTILMKLMVSKGTGNIKKVIETMGLGVFDGIEGVLNTAYDSMLGFCRIERAILAQCVWTAVNGFGRRMELKDDLMPSYNVALLTQDKEKERHLLTLIAKEKQLNVALKDLLKEIERNEKNLYTKERARDAEKERLMGAQAEYRRLCEDSDLLNSKSDRIKRDYDDYIKANPLKGNSDPEYKRRKTEYEEHARNLRNMEYRIEANEKNIFRLSENVEKMQVNIDDINSIISELRETLVEQVREFNELVMELENEACYLAKVLERKWKSFFVTLEFEQFICENVVKRFTQREIVEIEKLLTELDQSDDKNSFALRREQEFYVAGATVATGKFAMIYFDNNRVSDIKVKGKG